MGTRIPEAQRRWHVAILAVVVLLGMGCEPPISLPPEPKLTSITLLTNGDAGTLLIDFEDGDGNFGLEQGDTTDAFCPTCLYHHNVFCAYQERRDGAWSTIALDPELGQVPFHYRAPLITPTGQNKAQRGTITVELEPRYYLTSAWDTLRFLVHIVDRDLQSSDTLVTPSVTKP
ncbi:MAG: hypothetical protein ISP55_06540 [Flavobacteriales bacterium]|nr:hypothetical protein [Flavobacteriales bacterium]